MIPVEFSKDGKNLIIKVPLGAGTPSKSGKMLLVGQTGGWVDSGVDGLRVNVMVGKAA